jgi:uncharacterized protein YdhG (YjbR/CyaY superfamily)
MKTDNPKTIDDFVLQYPKETQTLLQKVRETIKAVAPEATETISYGIPTFQFHGNLVHFSGYAHHIGFYPGASGIREFANDLSIYKTSKGTVQFPLDKPIPFDLIRRITEFRLAENLNKVKKKE